MPSYDRAFWALRTWLDPWCGVGHVVVGMHRQGFDLQLTQYDERGGRATFYTTGMEHSPTSATGTRVGTDAVPRDAGPSNTMSELVDLGLALIAGVVVGIVLMGAWIKRGRR